MQIDLQLAERYAVLRLAGDFETYAVPAFLAEVEKAREAGRRLLVLNLRKVKFINSTAIGAILRARKELKAAGGGLAVARSSAFVREVFERLGLLEVVPFHPDEDEAIEALLALDPTSQTDPASPEEEAALLFRFYDQDRADRFGRRGVGAGEISTVEIQGLAFRWRPHLDPAEAEALFTPGTELEVKFRLPLYSRSTYYVTDARVVGCERDGDQLRVRVEFGELEDEAARAVQQYVADMALVREEIDRARQA
ncbi:MAG: STAS domain-containing protein [Planctomycetota bacterium]|nr:MAG: STAS domain-containing protein [Planctomycetota bacterium]